MTIEEVITQLDLLSYDDDAYGPYELEALDIAKDILKNKSEAEKKQVALEPVEEKFSNEDNRSDFYCPSCSKFLGTNKNLPEYSYCPFCGQKLEWPSDNKKLILIKDIGQWSEVIDGLYRFFIDSNSWYEIQVLYYTYGTPFLTSQGSLFKVNIMYAVEDKIHPSDENLLIRKSLLKEQSLQACLETAYDDFNNQLKENNYE